MICKNGFGGAQENRRNLVDNRFLQANCSNQIEREKHIFSTSVVQSRKCESREHQIKKENTFRRIRIQRALDQYYDPKQHTYKQMFQFGYFHFVFFCLNVSFNNIRILLHFFFSVIFVRIFIFLCFGNGSKDKPAFLCEQKKKIFVKNVGNNIVYTTAVS